MSQLAASDDYADFRLSVRQFIERALPKATQERLRLGYFPSRDEIVAWQRTLAGNGWGAPNWPKEFGGTGWNEIQKLIFLEESSRACAPPPHVFNITMLGPVLIQFGSDHQRAYWLPKLLDASVLFCQGFSEPNAGSDLASLRTRATRDGNNYVVNGQKIWTTSAHYADWIFCLVRTGAPDSRHRGISFLLIPLNSPGITVRPIISIDGRHSLNEVFFDNVKVPVENLVGKENQGWECARFLLANERTSIAGVARTQERLDYTVELASTVRQGKDTVAQAPDFRERVALLRAELTALDITQQRALTASTSDEQARGAAASALKIQGTELYQEVMNLLLEVGGLSALRLQQPALGDAATTTQPAWADPLAAAHLYSRAASIYGGANEIQKNILARTLFAARPQA